MWDYSDSGPNWLAECLTIVYRRDLEELMFERVFGPLGIGRDDLVWRRNQYRPATLAGVARREFGAGISANVEAMARLGLLLLRGGRWRETQLIPREFVEMARQPVLVFAAGGTPNPGCKACARSCKRTFPTCSANPRAMEPRDLVVDFRS